MAGVLNGGILGFIMNGVDNVRNGLPFFTTPEMRTEYFKQRMETEKERNKFDMEAVKEASKQGNMDALNTIIPTLIQRGAMGKESGEAMWGIGAKTAEGQQRMTDVMSFLTKQGQQKNVQQGGVAPSVAPSTTTPSIQPQTYTSPEQIPHFSTFQQMAQKYNVPLSTVLGLAHAEGGFEQNAKSPTGVIGVMQTTKGTTKDMGFDPSQRHVPEVSIEAGVKYLRHLADTRGIDLHDPEAVVMNYTTPAGGATPKYIKQVAQYKQQYAQMLGEKGGAVSGPTPGQQIPGTGNQHTIDPSLANLAAGPAFRPENGISFNLDKNGQVSGMHVDFSKMATTTDQQLAETLANNPTLLRAYTQQKVYGDVFNFEPIHNELTRTNGIRVTNKVTGMVNYYWDPFPSKFSPEQLAQQAGQQARQTAIGSEQGKIEGLQQPMPGQPAVEGQPVKTYGDVQTQQKAAETAAIEKEKRHLVPETAVTTQGGMEAYEGATKRINELLQTPTGVTLTGPMESLRNLQDDWGIFPDKNRIELRNLTAQLTDVIYKMRGKQLSDKELAVAEKIMPRMEQGPTAYAINLKAFKEYVERSAAANLKAFKSAGYTTDQLEKMKPEEASKLLDELGKYEKDKIYTDAQGRKARYGGYVDGKHVWDSVEGGK